MSWEPSERGVTDELISETFVLNQTHLRFREATARALAAAVDLAREEEERGKQGQANGDREGRKEDRRGCSRCDQIDVLSARRGHNLGVIIATHVFYCNCLLLLWQFLENRILLEFRILGK